MKKIFLVILFISVVSICYGKNQTPAEVVKDQVNCLVNNDKEGALKTRVDEWAKDEALIRRLDKKMKGFSENVISVKNCEEIYNKC